MSGMLRKFGKVVGTVASIAAMIPGPHQPFAAAIAVASNMALQATKSGPTARGQIDERILGSNNPLPYLIGRSYSGGVQVHDVGWGGSVNKVENPYRFIAAVHSCCGPVEALESVQLDYAVTAFSGTAASGYYADYLWRDYQLGARPEVGALTPQWTGAPRWGSSYKLSSMAAVGYSLKWSKKGKRFQGGRVPVIGAIWLGVKVYDPRQDSTFPGGSGSCRIDDESTYVWAAASGPVPAGQNPALHSGQYAYGRYVNGKKVFGVDLGASGVDMNSVAAWANVCETNGWRVNGTIYEPADKWNNLKRIAEAGAGKPVLVGGILYFDFQAPRTSLYIVTLDDLASGGISSKLGKGWKSRNNTIVPRYRSEAHQWTYQQAEQVQIAEWLAADGEEKTAERQWDLVTDVDQVSELGIYDLFDRHEAGPFVFNCKPHMRDFVPGDCLTLSAELGVHPDGAIKAIVQRRKIDPVSGEVQLVFEQETELKHSTALGSTGTAPSTITLPTSQELDELFGENSDLPGYARQIIATSSQDLVTVTATDTAITIGDHNRNYTDESAVAVTGATLSVDDAAASLVPETLYYLYYDDEARAGGAVAWKATTDFFTAQNSADNPDRHYGGYVTTDIIGGSGTIGGGSLPPGSGGISPYVVYF